MYHLSRILYSILPHQGDWDGVSKSFWYEAAKNNTYNWNIDPDSIEMMDDTIHEKRYHVFMLKNK